MRPLARRGLESNLWASVFGLWVDGLGLARSTAEVDDLDVLDLSTIGKNLPTNSIADCLTPHRWCVLHCGSSVMFSGPRSPEAEFRSGSCIIARAVSFSGGLIPSN